MTDRDLLELAAKAAEIEIRWGKCASHLDDYAYTGVTGPWVNNSGWNPLINDGDALRLAVKLRMSIDTDWNGGANAGNAEVDFFDDPEFAYQEGTGKCDPLAATRRAIVRAAAEIGRSMK